MDQDITGTAGITSGEAFGSSGVAATPPAQVVTGTAGIGSGEGFAARTGVSVDPLTGPVSIWISY